MKANNPNFSWQLRAAMSLVRPRERQGEGYAAELAEARAGLGGIYAHFTEGAFFPGFQEAAALISETG